MIKEEDSDESITKEVGELGNENISTKISSVHNQNVPLNSTKKRYILARKLNVIGTFPKSLSSFNEIPKPSQIRHKFG